MSFKVGVGAGIMCNCGGGGRGRGSCGIHWNESKNKKVSTRRWQKEKELTCERCERKNKKVSLRLQHGHLLPCLVVWRKFVRPDRGILFIRVTVLYPGPRILAYSAFVVSCYNYRQAQTDI
jgi:hypothetical protein